MPVGNGSEDLRNKFFAEKNGSFSLAAGVNISCSARECQEMLFMTFRAANAHEFPDGGLGPVNE
jgi:hypothetical protein